LVNGASALLKLRNEVGLGNIAIVTGRWADFWLKNDWGGVWPWEEDQLYLHSRIWGEGVTGFPVTGIPHEELPVSALLHELIELGGNLLGWDDETVDITALGVQAEFHDWLARRGEKPCQIEP